MLEYVPGRRYRDPNKRDLLKLLIDPKASKRVCIIGAGANGLATLKILAETHQVQSGQWKLVAFEERDNVGGIWYHPQHPSFSITYF
jgi:cation diffusion facilitator CzcD-associated flavoprotein CzcO